MDITHKHVVVTGGTRGLGKEIAHQFLDNGAYVIVTGRNVEEYNSPDPRYIYHSLDFLDNKSIKKFLDFLDGFDIDILVNNAGIREGTWDEVMQVNLNGPRILMDAVINHMKLQGGGNIVNIGSIAGIVSKRTSDAYATSKAGLIALSREKAIELAEYNILINTVCPGPMDTDMLQKNLSKETRKKWKDNIPLKRFAKIEEVAKIVISICRDNTYVTGQTIAVNGGFTVQ